MFRECGFYLIFAAFSMYFSPDSVTGICRRGAWQEKKRNDTEWDSLFCGCDFCGTGSREILEDTKVEQAFFVPEGRGHVEVE